MPYHFFRITLLGVWLCVTTVGKLFFHQSIWLILGKRNPRCVPVCHRGRGKQYSMTYFIDSPILIEMTKLFKSRFYPRKHQQKWREFPDFSSTPEEELHVTSTTPEEPIRKHRFAFLSILWITAQSTWFENLEVVGAGLQTGRVVCLKGSRDGGA